MGAEAFAPTVNNLYGRLDQNTRANYLDPVEMIARQNALQKQGYELEATRRALSQDESVRNALSGVKSVEDVRNAIPALMAADPKTGASVYNAYLDRQSSSELAAIRFNEAMRKMAGPEAQKVSIDVVGKLLPMFEANPQAYSTLRQRMIEAGIPPEYLPDLRTQEEVLDYTHKMKVAATPWTQLHQMNTPQYVSIPGEDEYGNPTTQLGVVPKGGGIARPPVPVTPSVRKNQPPPVKPEAVDIYNESEGRSLKVSKTDAEKLVAQGGWKLGKPLRQPGQGLGGNLTDAQAMKGIGDLTYGDPVATAEGTTMYLNYKKNGKTSSEAFSEVQKNFARIQTERDEISKALKNQAAGTYKIKVDGVERSIDWDGTKIVR